jgi:hypothetical protein
VTSNRRNPASVLRTASRFAILLSLLFGSAKSDAQQVSHLEDNRVKLRILFIGNSLTDSNNLPAIVQALAKANGENIQVDSVTLGGANLEDHWDDGRAIQRIAQGRWNIVILQQGPSSAPDSREHLREWTRRFDEKITEAGARTALYMVWPTPDRINFFDEVRESYRMAALDVKGLFFPAGEAIREAQRRNVGTPLYTGDQFHPSAAGSYAAGLSIYGLLTKKPLVGLPAELRLTGGRTLKLTPEVAKILQESAAEANRKFGIR